LSIFLKKNRNADIRISTAPGVRYNAKTIYKIQMAASGFKGRAK